MWSRRLAPSSSLAADLDDAPQDLVATTEEYERQDKFGGLWRGRQEPMGERRLADVINTEWGTRARKLVRENDRTYIYCRCQHGCKMVVQYRVDANAGRLIREAKNEHELKPDIRADIRATAAQAENAAAALVQFSMDNPDKDLPRRDQVQNRKNYMKPLQMEDKVPQVLEFAEALKKEEGRTSWGYRVLDIDKAAGIMCLSTDFYMGRLLANWEALKQHGLRLACDGTHNISNSRIKLIALGWLAQHVPHKSIQNTFVLLAFALSPTESGPAVLKLLRSTHAMISQHVREGLNAATLAHIDGGLGLVRGFEDFFGPDFLLVRSLEHVKRNIRDQGTKKLSRSSFWGSAKRWVTASSFYHNDAVFHAFWVGCFDVLEKAGERLFVDYLQKEHFRKMEDMWTATWRSAKQAPGYACYALNSVDSFFRMLDRFVPDESKLPLTDVMRRYEHAGRVLENEGLWADVCVEPCKLVTPALLGDEQNELSHRLDYKDKKQVGRLTAKSLARLMTDKQPMMHEVCCSENAKTQVFCKYGPADFCVDDMAALAHLEAATSPEDVQAVFRQIGALDEEGFHPRKVAHLYEKYTALYEEAADLVETHQDFWQSGMTEHYVFVAKESFGAAVPENFSSLVPRASPTGRPRGRPKGSKRPGAVPKKEPRVRATGRGGRGGGDAKGLPQKSMLPQKRTP